MNYPFLRLLSWLYYLLASVCAVVCFYHLALIVSPSIWPTDVWGAFPLASRVVNAGAGLIGVLTCGLMAEVCRLLPDLAGDLSASRAYLEMIANRLQK